MKVIPSRGGLAIWQLLATVISSSVALIVLSVGYVGSSAYMPSPESLLLGTGLVEACRLVLAVILYFVHDSENLATL